MRRLQTNRGVSRQTGGSVELPADCGDGRHACRVDEDGDIVCLVCRRVTVVGPMGINGITSTGERVGYISPFACYNKEKGVA